MLPGPEHHQKRHRTSVKRTLFSTEHDFVRDFVLKVIDTPRSPFIAPQVAREFYYMNGKIDIVAIGANERLLGFEAKLTKWKDALHQAYRNSSFCHFSYVLLPAAISVRAFAAKESFLQRRVGLCSFDNGRIEIKIPAPLNKPLQPWLTKSAKEFIVRESNADKSGI